MAADSAQRGGGSRGEAEEEVEEQLVMVELSGIIDSDFLEKCENKCKILVSDYSTIGKGKYPAKTGKPLILPSPAMFNIAEDLKESASSCKIIAFAELLSTSINPVLKGIETERPILQVDRYVFAGEYEDTLGTCVVFEENTEHADAEGNQKVQLKYKCHTMKKLNMTRTLLTEKKEGEENIGGVEWLQIKDRDFSYSRFNMICNFMREKEDSEESTQAQDKLTEESEGEVSGRGNSDMNCDPEKQNSLEKDDSIPLPDSPASGAEDFPSGSVALEDAPP